MNTQQWYAPYIATWGNEEPSQFPKALARTIPIESGKTRLLDIGCGAGIIGIFSLIEKNARSVTFADIERQWLDITRSNVEIKVREDLIKPSQVRFVEPGGFAEIAYEEVIKHDLMAFNPPQLPYANIDETTRLKIDSDPVEKRFRRGGPDGLDIAREFFSWYASLPKPKPDAVILLSSFLGMSSISKSIASYGLRHIGEPLQTKATLRNMFWAKAAELSRFPAELSERALEWDGGAWHKKLLTIRLRSA